ncbi:FAD-dependent oxidoreductase [Clostridium sp.]|uniref:FAD-dependent oxidoreductase n=1 Tax=Clostridium sp. TaxID=1506 RepID=UPI002FC70B5B
MGRDEKILKEFKEKTFPPFFAMEESARCLLCHDAPCSKACPVGTDPAKFIRSLRFRNLKGAIETIRENNILGGVCARVCPTSKYCEGACSRTGIDKPIEIAKLQRYLTDYEKTIGFEVLEKIEATKDKIAIIGSGPSGLSAATELAKRGYKVTVFEESVKLGGFLTYGIPEERLPQAVVDNEIGYIKNLGVEFITSCKVPQEKSIKDLRDEGFKVILLSTGMQKSKKISIEGSDLNGVLNGIDFLSEVKINRKAMIGDRVIVIGGGDVAIDCAVTAKNLGAADVKIVYRRKIENMPAEQSSILEAQNLNIPIFTGFKPTEIIGDNSFVKRFKATGMFDDGELNMPADNVIFAIGQEPENIKKIEEIKIDDKGLILTDNYKTNIDYIFAAGDIVEGDKTVVYALKTGKEAAIAIDEYLENKEGVR